MKSARLAERQTRSLLVGVVDRPHELTTKMSSYIKLLRAAMIPTTGLFTFSRPDEL